MTKLEKQRLSILALTGSITIMSVAWLLRNDLTVPYIMLVILFGTSTIISLEDD